MIFLTGLVITNILISLIIFRKLKNIIDASLREKDLQYIQEQQTERGEQDIHSILNHRLLDLQNRKYSVLRNKGRP